jgi:hypothetical protein
VQFAVNVHKVPRRTLPMLRPKRPAISLFAGPLSGDSRIFPLLDLSFSTSAVTLNGCWKETMTLRAISCGTGTVQLAETASA